MKASVWHGNRDIRIEEVPKPTAKSGHVVIQVAYAGICGTDRHEYTGPNFIPVEKPHRLTGKRAPLIIGHEFSGIITEIGEGVTGWKIGDRVTANGTLSCGKCQLCKEGKYNICKKLGFLGVSLDGAFAEYVEVEAARLFSIPNNLSLKKAVLAEPLACGIHATKILGSIKEKDAVVIGPGIIGIGAFLAARQAGAKRVLVVGVGKERKSLIEKYGGTYLDIEDSDLVSYVSNWTNKQMADIVYECVGVQSTLDSSISVLKPKGKLMVMGVFEKPPVFPMNLFQEGERELYTSQAHVDEIANALHYLGQANINAEELITREIIFDTLVQEGFEELLKNGNKHIKVILKINGEGE